MIEGSSEAHPTNRQALQTRRDCPNCKGLIPCDTAVCPHCSHQVEPWQFSDGAWWVKRGDRWYWLNATSNQWEQLRTK